MNKKQTTIDTYNKSAEIISADFNKLGARVSDIDKAFSYINKSNPKVVELGCGNGRDAREILKHTSDYVGVDASEKFIYQARAQVPTGKFVVEDFEKYTIPQNVDLIFAFASLLHTDREHMKVILYRCANVLNHDGLIMLSLKYGDYREETINEDIGSRTFYFYTPEELEKLKPKSIKEVHQKILDFGGKKWFTIIFQKQ